MRRRIGRMVAAAVLAGVAMLGWAPGVLAFPYHAQVGRAVVHAEMPIDGRIAAEVARADALMRAVGFAVPARDVYLTQGGWRWRLLASGSWGAFGLRRPGMAALIVNRSDIAADRVVNGAVLAGVRTLTGVIAHETTHLAIAYRIGEARAYLLPAWKSEGLADWVARESSLSDGEADRLRRAGEHPAALFYHDTRRRVAAALAANGGSVDRVLAE